MKKLKIILPLLLISLFFIPKVNASVVNTYTSFGYTDENIALQKEYSSDIDLLTDYVVEHGIGSASLSSGDYVLMIRTDQLGSNTITVALVKPRNGSGDTFNTSNYGFYMILTQYYQNFKIVNGVVSPVNNAAVYEGSYSIAYNTSVCNPDNTNCTLYWSNRYFDASYVNTTNTFKLYEATYNNPKNYGIMIGETEYSTGSNIPTKEFFDSFNPVEPFTCDLEYLGNFTNVSSVTFRVQGTTNALAEPLQGNVVLTSLGLDWNNFNGDISDIVVQTNEGPNFEEYLAEHHEISYNDGQLLFYYEVTSEDDIDTYIDILYTITYNNLNWEDFFENNVEIRACQPYHGTFTYAYRNNTTGITSSTDNILMNFLNNGSVPTIKPISDLIRDYPAGPVDSILTMPLTILQAISNKINSNTCAPLTLPIPFVGGNLYLPCINTLYNSINGLNTFITWASSVIGALLLYKYFIFLFKWFDSITSFRDKFNFGGY